MMDIRKKYDQIINDLETGNDKQKALEDLIDLFPEAANSYDHDIVDSIGLFVTELGDEFTINYLKEKISTCSDDHLKNEFNQWISHLQKYRLKGTYYDDQGGW
jgi:hypothetical protein